MRVLAIDPGTTESASLLLEDGVPSEKHRAIITNESVLYILRKYVGYLKVDHIAIEMVACYGMAVGAEVFETCVWIGRFVEAAELPHTFIYRKDVKMHFCNSMRAKDPNVRQAILDRFGGKDAAIGKKKAPGPLFGIKSHLWSALAVGLYFHDTHAAPAARGSEA